MSQVGFRSAPISCFNGTTPVGRRETLYAPLRMLCRCMAVIPLWLLRMLPASLISVSLRNLRGGAKSRAVKVPDLRSECGLGMEARSSKDEARGICGETLGEYGRSPPRRLSTSPSRWMRTRGANMFGSANASSLTIEGVGNTCSGLGGAIGLRARGGIGKRPLTEE